LSACIKKTEISNKWPNATSQTPRKQEQPKSKTSRWREIIKIRQELMK
jgi:hypothetical protein